MTRYVIIPTADLTNQMMNLCKKHYSITGGVDDNSLRTNILGTKTLLKFKDLESDLLTSYQWYTYNEVLIELQTDEWVEGELLAMNVLGKMKSFFT